MAAPLSIDTSVDNAIQALATPGTYFGLEVYDNHGQYLSTINIRQPPESVQLYCISLNNSEKIIYHLDLSNEKTIEQIKPILESFQITKVMRKCLYLSWLFKSLYGIILNCVFDLTSIIQMVNDSQNSFNCSLSSKLVEVQSEDVQRNMFQLVKAWIRIYGTLFGRLLQQTQSQLKLYRNI